MDSYPWLDERVYVGTWEGKDFLDGIRQKKNIGELVGFTQISINYLAVIITINW